MILLAQAAPLLVLLGLLASGRAGPLAACGLALLAALPGIALTLGGGALARSWRGKRCGPRGSPCNRSP
jgi:lactate permease